MAVGIMTGGTPEAPEITKSYEGAVLGRFERNGYDDSDFYAIVWDEAEQEIKNIEYATTRGWTYKNYAIVDATPEAKAKAAQYAYTLALGSARDLAVKKAKTPLPGKTVKVLKGKNAGKVGEVFWAGRKAKFHSYHGEMESRVGVKAPSGSFFTVAHNVEVLDPEEWIESDAEIVASVKRFAAGLGVDRDWRSLDAVLLTNAFYGREDRIPAGAL